MRVQQMHEFTLRTLPYRCRVLACTERIIFFGKGLHFPITCMSSILNSCKSNSNMILSTYNISRLYSMWYNAMVVNKFQLVYFLHSRYWLWIITYALCWAFFFLQKMFFCRVQYAQQSSIPVKFVFVNYEYSQQSISMNQRTPFFWQTILERYWKWKHQYYCRSVL